MHEQRKPLDLNHYGKIAPQATDIEAAVLGAMMLDERCVPQAIELLRTETFYKNAHQLIFKAIETLHSQNASIDILTVVEQLKKTGHLEEAGGITFVSELTNKVASSAHVQTHCMLILEKHLAREIIRLGNEFQSMAYEDATDVFEMIQKLQVSVEHLTVHHVAATEKGSIRLFKGLSEHIVKSKEHSIKLAGESISGVPTGLVRLDSITDGLQKTDMIVVAARPGMGKGLRKTELVATPQGFEQIGQLKVGDEVCDTSGGYKRVMGIYPQGERPLFKIIFSDGVELETDDQHLWEVQDRAIRKRGSNQVRVISTKQMYEEGTIIGTEKRKNFSIKHPQPVYHQARPLPIDPYILGLLLGDGSFGEKGIKFSNPEEDILKRIDTFINRGADGLNHYVKRGIIYDSIRQLGLWHKRSHEKFIPISYLFNTVGQRVRLLNGLIDTDGHVTTNSSNYIEYSTTSCQLKDDIMLLVRGLGGYCSAVKKQGSYRKRGIKKITKVAYRVLISFADGIIPVSSEKHLNRYSQSKQFHKRFIKSIIPSGSAETVCIKVNSDDECFLTSQYVVTHNTALAKRLSLGAIYSKRPVGLFSLEMSSIQLVARFVSEELGISVQKIMKGALTEEEIKKIEQLAADKFIVDGREMLFIDDNSSLTPSQFKIKARRMKAQYGIELLITDYLQLMESESKRYGNREQDVSEMSRAHKQIAKELDIPVVAMSQLSRSVEQRGGTMVPRLSDLRESGCLCVDTSLIYTKYNVQYNTPSRMKLLSLNKTKIVEMPSKNIPREPREIFRLQLYSGRFIDCTSNHPILTTDGYTELHNLQHTDSVACAINYPSEGRYIQESRFIGWMLGNGCMYGYNVPSFITADKVIADDFCAFIKSKFGFIPKDHPHYKSRVYQYDCTNSPTGNRTKIKNPVTLWLKKNGLWGNKAKGKYIPEWFMNQADHNSICELLQGLWETDGSVGKRRCTITYSTTSFYMGQQILYLLAKVGIFAAIDDGYLSDKATTPSFKINVNEQFKNKFIDTIPLKGIKNDRLKGQRRDKVYSKGINKLGRGTTEKIASLCNLKHPPDLRIQLHGGRRLTKRLLKKLLRFYKENKSTALDEFKWLATESIVWDRIKSITSLGVHDIFDRHVPKTTNFIVNGIIVHNSIEQDADLVLFIYRPEYYRQQGQKGFGEVMLTASSEKISSKGLAQLIIAKHRNGAIGDCWVKYEGWKTQFSNLNYDEKGLIEEDIELPF